MNHKTTGDRIPEVTFRTRTSTGWQDVSTQDLFAGRTVIVFSLPGAFTPTCSSSQLPGYNSLAGVFKANGVDDILCVSVNDAFVMQEWQRSQNADNITMIPDGNGEFTAGMGMLVDKHDLGFGQRSWRYSMLVRDGVIEQMFAEPDKPGDPYEVSDPETMLEHLNPKAVVPDAIALLTRMGCPHCLRAKALLADAGLTYEEIPVTGAQSLYALSGGRTTPQVFINGRVIGGADDLEQYLKDRQADRNAA
ncbi:MAG: glutathione peroxidase [Gammaproteobacteria bacterium]|nr:glutathione peroxidase [Gammaproteobacteria bacterium]